MANTGVSDRIPSHFLVRVESLHDAVADFEAAGFNVVWGQRPEDAHNALIHFHEGPFLELFEPLPHGWQGPVFKVLAKVGSATRHPMLSRIERWIGARGLCEWAIETNLPIEEVLPAIEATGTEMGKPRPIKRRPPEGPVLEWSIATPADLELPFIMDPYRPAPQIPEEAAEHENRIARLVGLDLVHPDPPHHAGDLQRYLGHGELSSDPDGVSARLTVGAFDISIAPGPEYRIAGLRGFARETEVELDLHGLHLTAS
ncbi:MAG: VOC family protein [Actinomycetota bacterium]